MKSLNENYELAIRMNVAVMKNIASSQALQNEYKSYLSKVTSLEWLDSGIVFFFQRIDQKIEKGADKFRDIGGKVKGLLII